MFKSVFKLFMSPRGRIGRQTFIICVVAWLAFYAAQTFWFRQTGTNQFNFLLSLALLFVNLQIIFSIYGKRLHDLGRSTWALIGMIALLILAAIFVMLNFGGLEYFETLYNNPEIAEDPVAMQNVQDAYQSELAKNVPQSRLILGALPILFTLWLAIRPGQSEANRYGDPITS